MTVIWQRAPTRRTAFYADHAGARLFVQQTVRASRAHGIVGEEYQGFVAGVRVGEFRTLDAAQDATIRASRHVEKAKPAGA